MICLKYFDWLVFGMISYWLEAVYFFFDQFWIKKKLSHGEILYAIRELKIKLLGKSKVPSYLSSSKPQRGWKIRFQVTYSLKFHI